MKRRLRLCFSCMVLALMSFAGYAQTGSITGVISDDQTDDLLIGATIVLKGTSNGTTTDVNGKFTLDNIEVGNQVVVVSYIGYENRELSVKVVEGQTTDLGQISLSVGAVGLKEVEVIASIAIDRKTPVAVSTIQGAEIEAKVGNQEFPEILRSTPSIYATKQGGGFGDSRINVRGFDQRNTAVLINGVPVNDMENGWVYWSNWAGLSDVTSNIQVQRGLSASKLAIASVGGTINIITNAADMQKATKLSYSVGNDGYNKFGIASSTGLMDNGWAISLQATHTFGNGYIDGTKFKAWSYFASIAKVINDNHSIHFTALGAPQWHHQRTIGSFDGVNLETFDEYGEKYNPNWGYLNGEEFTWRRNFYHKPKIFMNHYWTVSSRTEVASTLYVSYGRGGGTGPRGRINGSFDTSSRFNDENGLFRFDDVVRWNQGQNVPDFGDPKQLWGDANPDVDNRRDYFADKYVNTSRDGFVRRSSVNSHNWVGLLSNITHELSDKFTIIGGLDARYYKGIHYRTMENLLGADAYYTNTNINIQGEFITQQNKASAIADLKNNAKLNYHNDGVVKWLGVFGQLEYSEGPLSAFISTSLSNQGFQRIDYFNYLDGDPQQKTDFQNFLGGNVKGGANFNINDHHNVFANAGYYSRQPIFDNVFLNFVNEINEAIENEQIVGLELGYGLRTRKIKANVNLYRTSWSNRFLNRGVQVNGQDGTANLTGIDQVHTGIEFDMTYRILPSLRLDGMFSVGDWSYASDITAQVFDDNQQEIGTFDYFLDGVKVGDAAQTTARIGVTWDAFKGFRIYSSWYFADNLYADYSIEDDDIFLQPGGQAVKLPSYNLIDAGVFYDFKIGGMDFTWRLNVNNVTNERYIAELDTNIQGEDMFMQNRGFYGFGRTWNTGIRVSF